MKTEYFIAKDRTLLPAQDYEFLRTEGMNYIKKLGHKLWTDYNPHDPGITILEVLSYAITELGYRTDFDIKDLLSNKEGLISNQTFFPASAIFTNAPLTEIDYRKLIIDIDGVSNAWFLATQKTTDEFGFLQANDNEVPLYVNVLEDKLSLKNTDKNNKILNRLPLGGLNKVFIELEDNPVLGDLNSTLLDFEFLEGNNWIQVSIDPLFNSWNDPKALLFAKMDKPQKIKNKTIEQVTNDNGTLENKIKLTIYRSDNLSDCLEFQIIPYDAHELGAVLNHFKTEENICEFVSLFENKKIAVQKTFSEIQHRLHQNRNLSEDFLCIETIDSIEIAICADIEIEPQSNVIDVMAQIQITINDIINPPIKFYTLAQLIEQGYHSEDLFLGPKLTHGFLKDEEIINSKLPTSIHSSDIIAALMQIKGVISVSNMLLTGYDKYGKPLSEKTNKAWCLNLSGKVNPVFTSNKSKLLLFQKGIPFLLSETNQMMVDQKIQVYKSQQKNYKLLNTNNEFPFPSGQFYQLDEYYSIQDEFPMNYGLGKNKLSDKVPDKRKAQVSQLKGYLHFYDQILADFFNQLYNAKNLLDTPTIQGSYFPRYLEKDDLTGEPFYSEEIYSSQLKEKLTIKNDDTVPLMDDISLYESKLKFYERRNRSLDHLMARFGESFNDYVFMMYQVNQDSKGLGELSFQYDDLIQDKQNFINQYPIISSRRGIGMDYLNVTIEANTFKYQDFWDTDSRGGYEKRVAKLLGINDIRLRDIVTEITPQTQWTVNTKQGAILFKIESPAVDLIDKWNWAQAHILDTNAYRIDSYSKKYYIYLVHENKKIAKVEKTFSNQLEAYDYTKKLFQSLSETFENFYCLEHILLRPFENPLFNDPDLLPVCLQDDCKDEANNNPYSFKATIVLPGYVSRFRNLTFREYAEKIFRQEAPAHVLLKICWVNQVDMLSFQIAYKNWLENYRYYRIKKCTNTLTKLDKTNYIKNHQALIKSLNELNTMYPEGNLYDCHLSEISNPIILGNSALGTL